MHIPATFLIPDDSDQHLEITFRHDALKMAVIDRNQFDASLAADWDVTGFYLLFGPGTDETPGHYGVYIGRAAPGSIGNRIRNHIRKKEGWDRALLVTRTTPGGFNSTDAGWLEGRLHERLTRAEGAELLNTMTPGDDTISDWDREALERVVTLTLGVMRVLGYRSDIPTDREDVPMDVAEQRETADLDVTLLHRLIDAIEPGEWTTYGDLADATGSHPRGIGSHIRHCSEGFPAWRVMNRRGESQPGFVWTTENFGDASQADVLTEEGVPFDEGQADPEARVRGQELLARLGEDGPREPVEAGKPEPARPSRGEGGWLTALYNAGVLEPGSTLVGRYKGETYSATATAIGDVEVSIDGEQISGSLSLAARAITGYEMNGWTFWKHVEDGGEVSLAELRDRAAAR